MTECHMARMERCSDGCQPRSCDYEERKVCYPLPPEHSGQSTTRKRVIKRATLGGSDLGWSNFNNDLAEMASPHYWAVTFSSPQLLHNCKKTEKLPEQKLSHAVSLVRIPMINPEGSRGGSHHR